MPTRSALEQFKKDLEKYTTGKDTVRVPYDKPPPKAFIRKMAKYPIKEVAEDGALWMHKT